MMHLYKLAEKTDNLLQLFASKPALKQGDDLLIQD
jgi:hypothetical protein